MRCGEKERKERNSERGGEKPVLFLYMHVLLLYNKLVNWNMR